MRYMGSVGAALRWLARGQPAGAANALAPYFLMTGRPCRPSEDLKGLWRALLPGTPFPLCGPADAAGAEAKGDSDHKSNAKNSVSAKSADVTKVKSD
jgi:hypothetical protein